MKKSIWMVMGLALQSFHVGYSSTPEIGMPCPSPAFIINSGIQEVEKFMGDFWMVGADITDENNAWTFMMLLNAKSEEAVLDKAKKILPALQQKNKTALRGECFYYFYLNREIVAIATYSGLSPSVADLRNTLLN